MVERLVDDTNIINRIGFMEVAEHGVIYDDTVPGIHGELLIDETGMTVKLIRESAPDTEEIYEYSPNGNLISKATQKIATNT